MFSYQLIHSLATHRWQGVTVASPTDVFRVIRLFDQGDFVYICEEYQARINGMFGWNICAWGLVVRVCVGKDAT